MTNTLCASGTMSLIGEWCEKSIGLLNKVAREWRFYGEYGLSASEIFSEDKTEIEFSGTGEWGFSYSLMEFDNWIKSWLKTEEGELTKSQYNDFLDYMHDKKLRIGVVFNDRKSGLNINIDETGEFSSNGEDLMYTVITHRDHVDEWNEFGKGYFDDTVKYLHNFVTDVDEKELKTWIFNYVPPCHGLASLEYEDPEKFAKCIQKFCERFKPHNGAWNRFRKTLEDNRNIVIVENLEEKKRIENEQKFWNKYKNDNLKIDIETSRLEHHMMDEEGICKSESVCISRVPELLDRFGWRKAMPFGVSYWKDIKCIAIGRSVVARFAKGSKICSMESADGEAYIEKGWGEIIYLDAARDYSVAIDSSGYAHIIGSTLDEDVRADIEGWTDLKAVGCGMYHIVGLKNDGTCVATGVNDYGQCKVEGWTDIKTLVVKGDITIGLKNDGTVVSCGEAYDTKLDFSEWKDIVQIALSENFAVGLKSDGKFEITGVSEEKQKAALEVLNSWGNIKNVAVGATHILGLRENGTVVSCGRKLGTECDVEDWKDVEKIVAGMFYSFGIKKDGTVYFTGEYVNFYGYYDRNEFVPDIVEKHPDDIDEEDDGEIFEVEYTDRFETEYWNCEEDSI